MADPPTAFEHDRPFSRESVSMSRGAVKPRMKNDTGCALLLFLFFVVVPVIYLLARGSKEGSEAANRQTRADRVHGLIDSFHRFNSISTLRELDSALSGQRIRYVRTLESLFAEASPALTRLACNPATFGTVEWYFECFTFPTGTMANVLLWLSSLLNAADEVPARPLQRVVHRIMREAGPAEAQWLYDRIRERLRTRPGDLELRSLALDVGRISYLLKRSDHRLTVYDEQALTNDIAVCIK